MKPSNGVATTTATTKNDEALLKSEVASFASSLGFISSSSQTPSSGFNDSDLKKTGTLLKQPPRPKPKPKPKPKPEPKPTERTRIHPAPKQPPVLSIDHQFRKTNEGLNKYKSLPKLPLVKASALGVWYVDAEELEKKLVGDGKQTMKTIEFKRTGGVEEWKCVVEKKRELGERLMWQYANDFEESRGQSGDIKMVVATQRSGTAADKVSAFSVLVADNPLANLRSLDALLGMVASKVGKRHALTGFEALKELFINSLLPDRKLKTLLQRPVNNLPETKDGYSLLLFWYWEDRLKQRYEQFVLALEEASRDMLPVLKDKASKTMYALLKSKSEQERRLLSALVNKLGDPQNRGASNADFHLSNLLSDHPNMKAVVIDEVDSFLFRPHLGLRAKYHAINFLSQIRLSHKADGPKLAKRLIDVYFALFKVLVSQAGGSQKMDKRRKVLDGSTVNDDDKKKGLESHVELDSRLLSALLTGVNRAFPYVSSAEADDIIDVQTPMLFKLVHSKNFNVGVQALMLLDKISSKHQIVSDRFYRALYSKLLLPAAMNSSKAEMFFGLLLRAMKSDVNLKRVAAFSKRVLQVALQQPPQYACGCLFLLSELLKTRPPLWNVVLQNESVDEDIEHFEDIPEENDERRPLMMSDKEDDLKSDYGGIMANDKNNSSEDKGEKHVVSVSVGNKAKSESDSSEDEDEDENDSLVSSSEDNGSDEGEELLIEDSPKKSKGHQPLSDYTVKQAPLAPAASSLPGGYSPRHREPSYCNADRASWLELTVLASHMHPSVGTMARTLVSGANIVYNGNPLNDLSLIAFLDKFMEKKPKQTMWHGGSQIEPAKKLDMNNHLIGPEILSLAEVDVPPEDLVFHKFYMNKTTTSKSKKKKKKSTEDEAEAEEFLEADDADEGGGGDESDNEEIENMLDSTEIGLEAEGEYDYDDLDQIPNEDDDDLIGNASDAEMEVGSNIAEDEDLATIEDSDKNKDDDDDIVDIGDIDDGSNDDNGSGKRRRKWKSRRNAAASPFASLEEYEHLLNEDNPAEKSSTRKKSKSRKKRKSSD